MPRDKVRHYCLSHEQDEGQHKARIWRALGGFERHHAAQLQTALRVAASTAEVTGWRLNGDGSASWQTRLEIEGVNGKRIFVQARWRTSVPGSAPRLTSAWPEKD